MTFARKILDWYSQNKRQLPWRNSRNPYKIWLSEVMLQQTRVAQGTPYYLAFIANFPTVYDLASAKEEKVLKLWQGLGYYSRARNLHATAKEVVTTHDGKFPDTYQELIKLKGIGDYTASAIASICFDRAEPVVDGNVYRVLSRYFGVDKPINSTEGINYFKKLARKVMALENIRDYNQGIMEFGAIQCTPKKPNCLYCPLNDSCVALQTNSVDLLPIKLNKTKVRKRYFNYVVPLDRNRNTLLRQRLRKGIWQNLWEFPLFESKAIINEPELIENLDLIGLESVDKITLFNERPIIHKLSHQHLYTTFWIGEMPTDLATGIALHDLDTYAVPVLIAEFLETFKNSYF